VFRDDIHDCVQLALSLNVRMGDNGKNFDWETLVKLEILQFVTHLLRIIVLELSDIGGKNAEQDDIRSML